MKRNTMSLLNQRRMAVVFVLCVVFVLYQSMSKPLITLIKTENKIWNQQSQFGDISASGNLILQKAVKEKSNQNQNREIKSVKVKERLEKSFTKKSTKAVSFKDVLFDDERIEKKASRHTTSVTTQISTSKSDFSDKFDALNDTSDSHEDTIKNKKAKARLIKLIVKEQKAKKESSKPKKKSKSRPKQKTWNEMLFESKFRSPEELLPFVSQLENGTRFLMGWPSYKDQNPSMVSLASEFVNTFSEFGSQLDLIALFRQQQEMYTSRMLKPYPIVKQPAKVTRVLLLTYYRSGSSFLGDLLTQLPTSFYSFEPLHYMREGVRLQNDSRADEAVQLLARIFTCDFLNRENYNFMQWIREKKNHFLMSWNKFVWKLCTYSKSVCFDPQFLFQACIRANHNVIKVTRLPMRHVPKLMEITEPLRIKFVHLVRDPRGILSSRKTINLCSKGNNCLSIDPLCDSMSEDITIYRQLKRRYPNRFYQVRFEDLALRTQKEAEKLYNFVGLNFSPQVQQFIDTHTNATKEEWKTKELYGTVRDSWKVPKAWKEKLNVTDLQKANEKCEYVFDKLGYERIEVEEWLRERQEAYNKAKLLKLKYSKNKILKEGNSLKEDKTCDRTCKLKQIKLKIAERKKQLYLRL